jgi:hypothetical protein
MGEVGEQFGYFIFGDAIGKFTQGQGTQVYQALG